ncbi:GNAT family N-acetyltransferase [Burkholderia seminalis]|uniref:GNAT family N-acetyltransferase n=1 Tax=Burkholderia seminalis TaxID=488731 RepID=UPI00264E5961|nr:GNAT family N-acetyltransferase [Burkholderia seminalis]MDN7591452.1 GNAT family N-acetyltransferase [Burkholderia seminalis]
MAERGWPTPCDVRQVESTTRKKHSTFHEVDAGGNVALRVFWIHRLRMTPHTSRERLMLTIRPLSSDSDSDYANVSRVFIEAASYTRLVEGRSPSKEDVDDFFYGKPAGKDGENKSVFGLYIGPDMVGCADVIRAYPTDDCVWIGLLLFSDKHRSRGYGKTALALLDALAREWGFRRAQLAVVSTNPRALAFWQREGFEEIRRANNSRFLGELIVMERPIP